MKEFLKVFCILSLAVVAGFLWFASAATSVQHPDPSSVDRHFRSVEDRFRSSPPLLTMDGAGTVVRQPRPDDRLVPSSPVDLIVLAWKGPQSGLVEARLPIWLIGLKGPARDYLLRGTGFDPDRWGLTVADIKDAGTGVLIDHYSSRGQRLLVWTE